MKVMVMGVLWAGPPVTRTFPFSGRAPAASVKLLQGDQDVVGRSVPLERGRDQRRRLRVQRGRLLERQPKGSAGRGAAEGDALDLVDRRHPSLADSVQQAHGVVLGLAAVEIGDQLGVVEPR
ncbi:MAG: hypothetical protein U0797_29145 [Gemmataceae bacterium]